MNNKNIKVGIAIMLISSIMTCTGQLIWKLSSDTLHPLLFWILGLALYGIGAVCMIVAFRFGEVSVLQPMLSIGFVISMFLGRYILGEEITLLKIGGVILIILGMVFLGMSSKGKKEEEEAA